MVVPVKLVPSPTHYTPRSTCFAVLCHYLGWSELAADALLSVRLEERAGVEEIRLLAWHYWNEQLPTPGSDWRLASRHLQRLLALDPRLAADEPEVRDLLSDLAAAVAPRERPAGCLWRLIDDLVDFQTSPYEPAVPFATDTAAGRIARLGFAAVPLLLEALEDTRLTRVVIRRGRWLRERDLARVKDLALDLLQTIAGEPLGRRQARAWWLRAMAAGEEAYAAKRVLSENNGEVDLHQLAVIAERYPRHLPEVYRKSLTFTHPDWRGAHALADAVVASGLPAEEKRALLLAGARQRDRIHRAAAVSRLRHLDAAAARRELVATFLSLPGKFGEDLTPGEALALAAAAAGWDDALVWKAFEQTVRRADVDLRYALLLGVRAKAPAGAQRSRLLALLAWQLGEPAKVSFSGGFEMRDLVAREMAALLDVPDVAATPAALRAEVRAARDRERRGGD
jgi:hypothetical protein